MKNEVTVPQPPRTFYGVVLSALVGPEAGPFTSEKCRRLRKKGAVPPVPLGAYYTQTVLLYIDVKLNKIQYKHSFVCVCVKCNHAMSLSCFDNLYRHFQNSS